MATPAFSMPAGTYSTPQIISLSVATSGATICYTTDGTAPAAATAGSCSHGSAYASSLNVSSSETITALATMAGYLNSQTVSATYAIGGSKGHEYHVGPGQTYATIGAAPWKTLGPGDTVYIHYQATPYHEQFLISTVGTATGWIRVIGVPENGNLPIIDGANATTTSNSDWRQAWAPDLVEYSGVIHIGPGNAGSPPQYVEIRGLEVRGCLASNRFTGWNGQTYGYDTFCAGIYARGVKHLLIEGNVVHDNHLGVYNWEGDGSAGGNTWYDATATDVVLRGNYFYDNGNPHSYTEHQTYTESDGVLIEYNRYGPQKTGSLGSQLKDRSAGTVIRYNWIEQSPAGWDIDLVEPENGWPVLGFHAPANPKYGQDFVYGNIFINAFVTSDPDVVHWDEDHQTSHGRAIQAASRLYFYNNTFVNIEDASDTYSGVTNLFNETWGAFDCSGVAISGRIDVRNNIFASLPRTAGESPAPLKFGYCGTEAFDFGVSWISPGWTTHSPASGGVTGQSNVLSPASNNPGFVTNPTTSSFGDVHLLPTGASSAGVGGALAGAVTNNAIGLDLTPYFQYVYPHTIPLPSHTARTASGSGSDLGGLGR